MERDKNRENKRGMNSAPNIERFLEIQERRNDALDRDPGFYSGYTTRGEGEEYSNGRNRTTRSRYGHGH